MNAAVVIFFYFEFFDKMVSRYVTNGPVKEGICLLPPTHYRMMPPQRKFFSYKLNVTDNRRGTCFIRQTCHVSCLDKINNVSPLLALALPNPQFKRTLIHYKLSRLRFNYLWGLKRSNVEWVAFFRRIFWNPAVYGAHFSNL